MDYRSFFQIKNSFLLFLSLFLFFPTYAAQQQLTCVLEVVKGSCWKNYDVGVQAVNLRQPDQKYVVELPRVKKGEQAVLGKVIDFPCQTLDTFFMKAKFQPAVWEEDVGKDRVYKSVQLWPVSGVVKPETKKWLIQICFPKAFQNVPISLDYSGDCDCKFTLVPPKE